MRMRSRSHLLRSLMCLVVSVLPLVAAAASSALQEFVLQEYHSALSLKPDPEHGKMLFGTCAACHGAQGAGTSDGTVPAIAAQHFNVVAHELADYRHDMRWDERMAHFTDEHHLNGAQDIADVAAYINALKPTRSLGRGSGEYVAHGATVYAQQCASCHGTKGEGDNTKGYPRLAGQHYQYLQGQLHAAVAGQRPNFPGDHVRLLAGFQNADFTGVCDYLSRLGP